MPARHSAETRCFVYQCLTKRSLDSSRLRGGSLAKRLQAGLGYSWLQTNQRGLADWPLHMWSITCLRWHLSIGGGIAAHKSWLVLIMWMMDKHPDAGDSLEYRRVAWDICITVAGGFSAWLMWMCVEILHTEVCGLSRGKEGLTVFRVS